MEKTNHHSSVVSLAFLSGLDCVMLMSKTNRWFTNMIICFPFLSSPYQNAGTEQQILALLRYLKQIYHLAFALICEICPKCAGTNLKYSFYKVTEVFQEPFLGKEPVLCALEGEWRR